MNSKVVLPAFSIKGGKADLSGVNSAEGVASDVMELAQQLSFVGELYVFDADAEAGDLDMNKGVLDSLLDKMPVRIGGGFSTNDRVYDWLDKGATQVEVAYRESNLGFLDGVPRERITISVRMEGISAGDDLTVEGGKKLSEAMEEISYYGKHLLVRYEGASESFRETISAAKAVVKAGIMMCVQASCITPDDIAWLDSQGMETILCDQILNGSITLGQALGAALVSDRPDGLIPTVVVDEDMVSLGLCYSKRESLNEAVNRKVGVYWRWACPFLPSPRRRESCFLPLHARLVCASNTRVFDAGPGLGLRSRTRGLWIKGLTSGATQELIRVDLDCDRDSMRWPPRRLGDLPMMLPLFHLVEACIHCHFALPSNRDAHSPHAHAPPVTLLDGSETGAATRPHTDLTGAATRHHTDLWCARLGLASATWSRCRALERTMERWGLSCALSSIAKKMHRPDPTQRSQPF
jgi:phosphoribosyl-ATP pyrophosphohydrolase/phosphoribosyl-AMP cyclohydrolase